MSQEKVDRYKERKRNRKAIEAKKKREVLLTKLCAGLLVLALVFDLGCLAIFKYAGFVVENLNALGLSLPMPEIALPIGISFFTFQILSYIVDVYRGKVVVQRSFWLFLLYVSLCTQLIAGPIVRYADVEQQMADRKTDPGGDGHYHHLHE